MQVIGVVQTFKKRKESFLKSLPSILEQKCDIYYIYLGNYNGEEIKEFNFPENAIVEIGENQPSFYRFKYAEHHKGEEKLMVFFDDDITYSPYHVQGLIENLKLYPKTIFAYGGSRITFPLNTYYKDRDQYSIFQNTEEPFEVDIINTVCGINLYAHKNFSVYTDNIESELILKQSSDILLSVYARKNDIPLVVLPHESSLYVNNEDENSLWTYLSSNEKPIINYLKSNKDLFNHFKGTQLPLVSVIVANSRDNEWVGECYRSIKNSYYPNIEIIEIENFGKAVTIGKAYNDGVSKAKGKYVLFVGDDDFIGYDYIMKLVLPFEYILKLRADIVCSTSFTTFVENNAVNREDAIPTGMWLRRFLLDNPFKEFLTHQVDTEMFERVKKMEKGLVCNKDYGYFYRCHDGQSSGKKSIKGKVNNSAIEFVNNLL